MTRTQSIIVALTALRDATDGVRPIADVQKELATQIAALSEHEVDVLVRFMDRVRNAISDMQEEI